VGETGFLNGRNESSVLLTEGRWDLDKTGLVAAGARRGEVWGGGIPQGEVVTTKKKRDISRSQKPKKKTRGVYGGGQPFADIWLCCNTGIG